MSQKVLFCVCCFFGLFTRPFILLNENNIMLLNIDETAHFQESSLVDYYKWSSEDLISRYVSCVVAH